MFSKIQTRRSIGGFSWGIETLGRWIMEADAVVVGAGAGLSLSAGFSYSGERFRKNFSDFIEKYGFQDMYTAGFYPFECPEEYWAYWSRYIYANRYDRSAGKPYVDLLTIVGNKDYFILTTNVDHQFQTAGFDKNRLFYMQGDFGLFQCSTPCCRRTYDNERAVRRMVEEQRSMRIPSSLIPRCPVCGAPMSMNLRVDGRFVEDWGWRAAAGRYQEFLLKHSDSSVIYLELGVGENTPGIIRYAFPEFVRRNERAAFARVNLLQPETPRDIGERSVSLECDCGEAVAGVLAWIRSHADARRF